MTTQERPIFTASRRPPPRAVAASPADEVQAPPPLKVVEAPPPLMLVGAVLGEGDAIAIFVNRTDTGRNSFNFAEFAGNAAMAGIGNAAILGLINRGASIAATDGGAIGLRLLVLFLFCMLAFYYGKRYALIQASVIVEHMVRNRLVRVADKMRRTELEIIEETLRLSGKPSLAGFHEGRWLDCAPSFEDGHFLSGFGHPDGKFRFKPDWAALGVDHARMPKRRDITLLLQLEAHLIDAAGGIDREHEREVDRLAGVALLRAGGRDEEENCEREYAPDQAATRCIAAPA